MVGIDASGQEYNKGMHPGLQLKAELVVNDRAEAMVLHDKPFEKDLSWLEYDLDSGRLEFIMEDGDIRDFGFSVDPKLEKYLQNAYHVLMVRMDAASGEYEEEESLPLIIHRT